MAQQNVLSHPNGRISLFHWMQAMNDTNETYVDSKEINAYIVVIISCSIEKFKCFHKDVHATK